MEDKISVITVVYNDVEHIRETMESFFSQTWENKEYIVIDGGSTDGTADIIREYSDRLAFWCSEKDGGIYDAMNKGIAHVTGNWINILNSGDRFFDGNSLKKVMLSGVMGDADVVYGNSVQSSEDANIFMEASGDTRMLDFGPIYRHGSSLIRADVQREFLYAVNREKDFGYALDWHMIYRVFKAGYVFKKVDVPIQCYREEGVSNNPLKSIFYDYKVISDTAFSLGKYFRFLKKKLAFFFKRTSFYRWMSCFFLEIVINDVLPIVPFWRCRRFFLKKAKVAVGKGTFIMKRNYFMSPNRLAIGEFSHINRGCVIDARGSIKIGNNVSISHNVNLMTGGHKMNSRNFKAEYLPIVIKDFAWLGVGCTILKNVTIGKGAVICAGAVVTKDVEDFAVYAGVPAKKIGERSRDIDYHCEWNYPFT